MEPDRDETRSILGDLIVFVFVAFVFRAFMWWAMGRAIDSSDAILYLTAADDLAHGKVSAVNAVRLPILFPLLTALFGFCTPDIETAARLVSLVSSSLTIVPVYLLARDMLGRPAARITALILALWAWPADYGSRETPEALACLFWFGGVYALVRAMRGTKRLMAEGIGWVFLAPLCLFAMHLTRPEGTFFALGAIIVAALLLQPSRPTLLRPFVMFAVLMLLFFVHSQTMRQLTGSAAINPRVVSAQSFMTRMVGERGGDIASAFISLSTEALPIMIGPYILLFAGVGIFTVQEGRKRDIQLEVFAFAVSAMQVVLAAMSGFAEPRYVMAPVIVATMWGAAGMAITSDTLRVRGKGQWSRAPVAGMLIILSGYVALTIGPELVGRMPREPREYRDAGLWMKQHVKPGLIITRKPQIGFYAGMETTGPSANEDPSTVLQRARFAQAQYIVIDERYTPRLAPGLVALLDPANAPPGMTLLHEVLPKYKGARVVIYSVDRPTQ